MKKLLFFAAATAVALSSCSKDEVTASVADAQNAISFSTYSASATKTISDMTSDAMKTSGFKVNAVYNSTADVAFMSALAVTWDDDSAYEYSGSYYWPTGVSYIDFLAYDTASGIACSALTTESGAVFSSYASDGTKDPVIAYNNSQTTAAVALTFKHALAKISTTVESKATDDNLKLYITDITYSNFDGEAICSVETDGDIVWGTSEVDASFQAYVSVDGALNTGISPTAFTLIPNTAVTATIKGYWMNGSVIVDSFTDGKSVTGLSVAQGVSYTYNFQITPNVSAISFTVTEVTGWDTTTGGTVDTTVN